ncbi:MAG: hypothetical protein HND46_23565 [Chloroflexi bacterium]|nr:hypothetical protein [Chloroflexota bacterium]NOG66400.1 hypothetical protein [Chloroflexota bacterium]
MSTRQFAILLVLCCLFNLADRPVHAQGDPPAMPQITLNVDGVERTYRLFVPSTYNTPAPLVIAFHGAGGDGASMARLTTFNRLAESAGVIVAYPEGLLVYWDYGVGTPEWAEQSPVHDEISFISAMLDQLANDYTIDPTRIYAVGFSNGARMAFRVGCEFSDRISKIAAVSATISSEITENCPTDARVSVLYMHGTGDDVTPWAGKPLYDEGGSLISYALSAPDTVNFWLEQNGCPADTTMLDMPDANPDDEITVRQAHFTGCENGHEVVFYAVIGGSHAWEGGIFNLMPSDYAPSASATEYVWAFLGFEPYNP